MRSSTRPSSHLIRLNISLQSTSSRRTILPQHLRATQGISSRHSRPLYTRKGPRGRSPRLIPQPEHHIRTAAPVLIELHRGTATETSLCCAGSLRPDAYSAHHSCEHAHLDLSQQEHLWPFWSFWKSLPGSPRCAELRLGDHWQEWKLGGRVWTGY